MMSFDRTWMYRRMVNDILTPEFLEGLEIFVIYAQSKPEFMDETKIKCPCTKCKNKKYDHPSTVKLHLAKNGFVPRYDVWCMHGEKLSITVPGTGRRVEREQNRFQEMVMDAANSHFPTTFTNLEESPNPVAKQLYDMLKAADRELWPGCTTHSQLSLVARLMGLKSEHGMSERCFDEIVELIKEVVPPNNLVTEDFYNAKKLLRGMGLPVEKIDCCRNNCMLFWREDDHLTECKFCDAKRYKDSSGASSSRRRTRVAFSQLHYFPIAPRLQRLYASNATAAHMRWHDRPCEEGTMKHPADSAAWKHLNERFPDFAAEVRNVRRGLCSDDFQPFNKYGKQYSS